MSASNQSPDPGSREQKRALLARLLRQQTGKSRAQSAGRFVHELFSAQAERSPEAVALTGCGITLSYRELNQQANRIAAELLDRGAKPEARIGLCLERVEAIVGLVGIFKAGASYVPLPPNDPPSRLEWMVQDAGISLLLSQRAYGERLPAGPACLFLDDLAEESAADFGESVSADPRPALRPDNLAYVVYTSGTTGTPRGVLVEHRALSNLIAAQVQAYEVGPTSRVLQFASLSFDASIGEIWRALTSGACLCVLPAEARLDGEALLAFLAEQRITHATLPPTLLSALPQATLPDLTNLIVGGDACPAELVSRWAPGRRFFNAYGPSEAAVCATFARCTSDGRKPPIGRPIANTTAYVLDAHLRPVPLGMSGELYLGGIGLARGYLGRPGLTADRFIPNPFAAQPGARLYKTGDLCRWLPGDGLESNLEFLGRIDQQVKVRGYRIEPGEIETSLYHHPAVRQAVVVARENREQGKRLIAYVVLADPEPMEGTPVDYLQVLRNHLTGALPQYMVPSEFVFLPALPLTSNGKVDVKSLPDPAKQESEPGSANTPRNQREEILAEIWGRLLKRNRVGIHDNFFALGGDSILSIQIVARANQAGLRLRVRDVLQHQTIAELARVAEDTHPSQADQGVVTGPVPLTPIQHWFFERDLPDPHHFNQAIVLEQRQPLDPELFEQALRHLMEHHDALRLRFVRDAGSVRSWQQVNAGMETPLALIRADLSGLPEEEQVRAFEERATRMQSGFDLGSTPLLQVAWFDRGPARSSWLLLIGHHLTVDTVSWAILLEDLWTTYRQLQKDQTVRLPAKTTAFKHWAERLVAYARSEELAQEREYWLSVARAEVQRLPVDHPHGENTRDSLASVHVILGIEDSQALLEVPRFHKMQINEILLTALILTFERWTGQCRVLLAVEGHGREEVFPDVDLSRSVGWYTSLFPLLLDLGSAANQGEALRAVKEQVNAVPNRGIGYGVLRYLSPDADLREQVRREPEVSFNYFGQSRGAGESGGGSILPGEDPLPSRIPNAGSVRQAVLPTGPTHGPGGMRNRLLTINCAIRIRFEMHWSFSTNVHQRATIERLAQDYLENLRSLVAFCQGPEGRILTAADFPAARLSESDLEKVLAQLGGRDGVK